MACKDESGKEEENAQNGIVGLQNKQAGHAE